MPDEVLTAQRRPDHLHVEEHEMPGWFVVCGLFLGVRTEELMKLKVDDVRLTEGFLHVGPHIAKKRRIRNINFSVETRINGKVKALDPVTPWLSRLPAPANGMIAPPSCLNRFYKTLLSKAEIHEWPANGMRHSYASYLYALTNNSADTCARLGHRRDDVLFEFYRALTTAREGLAYFTMVPSSKKIISIAAAARTASKRTARKQVNESLEYAHRR